MPGLRILLRWAPFFVGALAAAVWLRRRAPKPMPLPAPPARPELTPPAAPPEPAPAAPAAAPPARFEREPISIVTVVDDLLEIGR